METEGGEERKDGLKQFFYGSIKKFLTKFRRMCIDSRPFV